MNRGIMASVLSLAFLSYAAAAGADDRERDRLVRFEGGIGVIPVSSGVVPPNTQPLTAETVNRNFVRGVPPAGQIWTIRELRADVRTDGSARVDGRGLLLAGGDNIGTTGGQSVRVRLLCGPGNGVALNTDAAVLLEPDGDFRIDAVLSGTLPAQCDRPVLLILNGAGTVWFAAGIPKL